MYPKEYISNDSDLCYSIFLCIFDTFNNELWNDYRLIEIYS